MLRKAGIKVWMLTGDKMETAHCISISTGLLASEDKVWQIERVTNGAELQQIMRGFRENAVPQQVKPPNTVVLLANRWDQSHRSDETGQHYGLPGLSDAS